uniref:HAT C-terminal dimerisation domain-containing protein n=1 Tax=Sinocyclocheilus anshuiensis TaxID=1608454 RepID=A0A671Q8W1_9TELE
MYRISEKYTFTSWKCNHYFEFISVKGKNIIVHCHLSKNSTSNLLKHLKGQHSTVKPIEMVPGAGKKCIYFCCHVSASACPSPAKRQKLNLSCPTPTITGEGLKKLVAWYIVENMLSISTVDSPSFWCIIEKIPTNNKASLPHRKMFAAYLEREYAMMEASLKATLEEVGFISTTADIWTANNRSYMGVTLHWMDRNTLKGNKAALACKRLRGRHTFDVIAAELEQIHSSYGLLNEVVATVTDNASNFIKAFKTYQIATSESDDDEEEQEEGVTFTDVTEKYFTSSTSTKTVYKINIAKCTALWTKASRSTVASEQVQVVSQRKLLVPSSTRWNSFHEAVSRITEIPMNELNSLCTKLGVKCFNDKEHQLLHEYCNAMKPLTAALDILQGDNCSYGALLPTLEVLMAKTLTLKDTLSRMTADLPDVIVKVCSYTFDLLANFGYLLPCTIMIREQSIVQYVLRSGGYEFESLNQFPNIKNIFLKFNTPTPSSAPVEWLFSLGDLVLTPRRNRLSDKRFEKLLLMRYNHCFT